MAGSRTVANFVWTAGAIGASSAIKFGQNVVLSRLLMPEILGVMVVVNSVRLGVELLTDVGIEQNIVHHRDGLDRGFRDTAWTLQVLRGLLTSTLFFALSPALAGFYGIDVRIFLVASCAPLIGATHSTAIFALVKQLEVRRRSLFELGSEVLGAAVTIALALAWGNVWAPAVGLVLAVLIRSALSFTLPDPRQRLHLDREAARRIIHFGKWIALTSVVMFAATNLDRLYLGRVVPLSLLGIYGIARAIAELPTTLARRISYQVVFPSIARAHDEGRTDGHLEIARTRMAFVLLACGGIAAAAGVADLLVGLVYDPRYHAAGWMLAVLLLGAVFAVLSNLNEALVLAAGKPAYSSYANLSRLGSLGLALVGGFHWWGMAGAVMALAAVEVCQYGYIAVGQLRVGQGFWRQDALAVAFACGVLLAVLAVRGMFGWGTPFAQMGAM